MSKQTEYIVPTGVVPHKDIIIGPGFVPPPAPQSSLHNINDCLEVIKNPLLKLTDTPSNLKKHNHYFKDVTHLNYIDVYRVISLFNVTDPCLQHAIKKLLVAGGRGAGKDIDKDIQEAVDSLQRFQEMKLEDASKV